MVATNNQGLANRNCAHSDQGQRWGIASGKSLLCKLVVKAKEMEDRKRKKVFPGSWSDN
jgi:hypothetical protein